MNEQAKILLEILERDRKLMYARKDAKCQYTYAVLTSILQRYIISCSLKGMPSE